MDESLARRRMALYKRRPTWWFCWTARLVSVPFWLASLTQASGEQSALSTQVTVEGTAFQIVRNGLTLPQEELVGVKLAMKDAHGAREVIRIDQEMLDPADPSREIQLYKLSAQDERTGDWLNICHPGPDGLALGFPMGGTWTPDGRHLPGGSFSLTCTDGAVGKCVRYGYKPWKIGPVGARLWDYHQACTRMLRADYCGDGVSWTRDGTPIDLWDRLGVQRPDRSLNMPFEAAWGNNGAVCVSHTRIPERITVDDLVKRCPEHLLPPSLACDESGTADRDDALISNGSIVN